MRKILFLGPDLNNTGGVSFFCKTLMPYMTNKATYCVRGLRYNRKSIFWKIIYNTNDFFKISYSVIFRRPLLVHFNISFAFAGVYRDLFYLFLCSVFRIKFIIFFHGWDYNFENKTSFLLIKKRILKSNSIIVLSKKFKDIITNWGYENNIYIMTNPINEKYISINKAFLMNKYNVIENYIFLFLSRIEKEKGIYEAIEMFKILHARFTNSTFRICGAGSELNKIKEYIKINNIENIEILGFCNDSNKKSVLEESHFMILLSYHEGLPISILEGMSFGLPIITRPVGGISDLSSNINIGYVTESLDPAVIANDIETILDDSNYWKNISINNFNYSKENFYSDKVYHALFQIYKEVCNDL